MDKLTAKGLIEMYDYLLDLDETEGGFIEMKIRLADLLSEYGEKYDELSVKGLGK